MPRPLRPNQRFPIELSSDAETPKETRPRFFARSMSCQEWSDQNDKLADLRGWDQAIALAKCAIIGWENMVDPTTNEAIPFDLEKLATLIDHQEAIELIDQLSFGIADKKKSA